MTRLNTTLASFALFGLAATPASAQPEPVNCTGDYVCSDPAVVATWPLDRWNHVRRAHRQTAATERRTRKQ